MRDLVTIYTSKPALYTSRLIDLMFGEDTLRASCLDNSEKGDTNLVPLDQNILESVLTHIVHVFQHQKQEITYGMVKNFIRNRLDLLRTNIGSGSIFITKKPATRVSRAKR
ncbi:uncharacterized protein LOC128731427 [Anopheles nili]|uniref:uncharacterized protein LOC128731427 n=1 Tax=Anopheles nili TaxID=185578 RepID=UPI00237A12A2|nr:uncharacterized protein LOC128731427 [Anopheles nili]